MTQRLKTDRQRAVRSEQDVWLPEAERSALFVSVKRLTPPLLTPEGRHHIWTRLTKELPRALPFGEEVFRASCFLPPSGRDAFP